MPKLTLALDWTPNINHIGFFIAQEKGFYHESGIELEIVDPSTDNYAVTPAKKVELGQADFALCPTESIISYRTKTKPFPLIAIAAILQSDLSAIVVKKDSNINAPKDLDGKVYASYDARYEDEIVRQMIRNDGGKGNLNIQTPSKLGIWDTLLDGSFDATWIFLNWEALQSEALGQTLQYFKMSDYQIPYSYSPVIATNQENINNHRKSYEGFLAATKKGYLFAQENKAEAVKILQSLVPDKDQNINLAKALDVSAPHFGNIKNWGMMEHQTVRQFLDWIYEKGLESQQLELSELMTNELVEYQP